MAVPFVGLTGGIASGKTETLAAFERHGAATLSTDQATHDILATESVRDQLVERWGERVAPGGTIDRQAVAEVVFGQPEELRWLESVIHPLVGLRIVDWRAGVPAGAAAAVVETPLLFEAGLEAMYEVTVAVLSAPDVVADRLEERGAAGQAGRADRQLTPEEKAERADYVIVNDGTLEELDRKVAEVLEQITARAGGGTAGGDE